MANNLISSLQLGSGDVSVFTLPYGVCETAEGTAAKTVTVKGDFTLEEGAIVLVKFTAQNKASSPTLNVNGTGAKPIMRYGTTAASTSTTVSGWVAGAIQMFIYDGTNWIRDYWSNTTYTNAALGQGYATCSTAAATAAKTASLSSYALTLGGIVVVKFTNGITVANPTLNINSKGAKKIFYKGSALTDTTLVKANDTVSMIYDGTQYQMFSIEKDTNTDTMVKQNKLADGIGVGTKLLTTSPGRVDTATDTAYFYTGLEYIDSTNTISAKSTGVICSDEEGTTLLDNNGLSFGHDSINGTNQFNINKNGIPSGESLVTQ